MLAAVTVGEFDEEEAVRLLQLGMACSNPNPGERRPSMVDTVKIIGKVVAAAGCDSFQAADGVATVKVELSDKPLIVARRLVDVHG